MPRASLIITTHNRPHLLPRAVASAVASARDVEIIVVDDASQDQTREVCQSLTGIRYVRVERNQRVAGARNIGLMMATTPFIGFLDDDDVRLPGSLDRQLDVLEAHPEAGLIYSQMMLGDADCNPSGEVKPRHCPTGDIFNRLIHENFIPCAATVFRRECLFHVGLLDPHLAGVDDWDLWVRIAELYPAVTLPEPVVIWRVATPQSGQGSSTPLHLVALSVHARCGRWRHLPRARSGAKLNAITNSQTQPQVSTVPGKSLTPAPKFNSATLWGIPWRSLISVLWMHPTCASQYFAKRLLQKTVRRFCGG
jgi:hypothetical protein